MILKLCLSVIRKLWWLTIKQALLGNVLDRSAEVERMSRNVILLLFVYFMLLYVLSCIFTALHFICSQFLWWDVVFLLSSIDCISLIYLCFHSCFWPVLLIVFLLLVIIHIKFSCFSASCSLLVLTHFRPGFIVFSSTVECLFCLLGFPAFACLSEH